jgi:hypothetical protein
MAAVQEWEPVVLKKKGGKKPTTATGLSKAIAEGKVETVKRSRIPCLSVGFVFSILIRVCVNS